MFRITNYELRITNKKGWQILFFMFLTIYSLLLATSAHAWIPGEPLVPCGHSLPPGFIGPPAVENLPCTKCELLHLVDNLVDFIMIALAPIVATLFFVVAGVYIMLGGANPGMLSQGKAMFTNTLTGLIIVMLAWLITNTLITTLVTSTFDPGGLDFNSAKWWELACDKIF